MRLRLRRYAVPRCRFHSTIVERDGRVPLLELAGGELEPVGIEIEETDQLGCVSPEDAREYEIDVAPARHSVSMVWRGSGQTEELELVLSQRCIGDPRQQGGEVDFERELVWVLERDDTKVGWRQVSARLSSSQSSGGDGVSQSELRRQSVYTWRAGPVGLVGRRIVVGHDSYSNWGSRSLDSVSHDWWLVPTSALDIGLDEGIFDEAGLRLSPRPVADDRQAYARYTMGERRLTGSCALSLGSTEVRVSCGNEVLGAKMGDAMGETERFAEVWDLGAALLLKLGIARDHRYTEPLSEEDPTPVERVDQEDAGMTLLLSKRDGTLIQLSRSSSSGSM